MATLPDYWANERTYLAGIRTALSVVALGMVVVKAEFHGFHGFHGFDGRWLVLLGVLMYVADTAVFWFNVWRLQTSNSYGVLHALLASGPLTLVLVAFVLMTTFACS